MWIKGSRGGIIGKKGNQEGMSLAGSAGAEGQGAARPALPFAGQQHEAPAAFLLFISGSIRWLKRTAAHTAPTSGPTT